MALSTLATSTFLPPLAFSILLGQFDNSLLHIGTDEENTQRILHQITLIFTPVTPQQTTSCNVAINLGPGLITTAFCKIGCNQMINLTFIEANIYRTSPHPHEDLAFLHIPSQSIEFLPCPLSPQTENYLALHQYGSGLFLQHVHQYKVLVPEHCFCFFIILINRRYSLPQRFIELHLSKNIKLVIYFQFQVMERMQPLHTLLNIFVVQWIAYSSTFQKFCDFVAIFRIDISNIIADMLSINSLIN